MKKRTVNFKFLGCLLGAVVVLGVGVHFLHAYQVQRNAGELLRYADRAEKEGDLARTADYLARYIRMVPADDNALARYGLTLEKTEAQLLLVMATDGIPVAKLVVRPDPNLEAVAAEYTALLRASVSAAGDTGVGDLREMCVVTDRMTALLTAITPEYFLFAALGPDALAGRARYALRVAGLTLQPEFV